MQNYLVGKELIALKINPVILRKINYYMICFGSNIVTIVLSDFIYSRNHSELVGFSFFSVNSWIENLNESLTVLPIIGG